jgi:serine/threonine-protein kinase HipA
MLKVYVGKQLAGKLFKSESEPNQYHFAYDEQCPAGSAVSLSMPVVNEHYTSNYTVLHPIFDMNLPEGALAERLRKLFSKTMPQFDALALLSIIGKSQIGRLRFASVGETPSDIPTENVGDLLAHDGAEDLFESLLNRYAIYSGISGAMPKVMLRDSHAKHSESTKAAQNLSHVNHKGASHIVKAWTNEYPRLAENEYFCMRAALHSKLDVPHFELSKGGQFLVLERFDLTVKHEAHEAHETYLGFEDFCVLNGKTAAQKYDGSYENITKRIKDFVSAEQVQTALEAFFKALALSCAVKNGDAHLKNFGVLYEHTHNDSTVRLSPFYDIVCTTVYSPSDILALTLNGTKRWPTAKILLAFARAHCNLSDARATALLTSVAHGVEQAAIELRLYLQHTPLFQVIGEAMLTEWQAGLTLSIDTNK